MTSKHQSPEWRRTVKIIRTQVALARKRGEEVVCWRCGWPIEEEALFDVGHLDPQGGEGVDNAAPEHYRENRSHGGRMGARITNTRRAARVSGFVPPAWATIAPPTGPVFWGRIGAIPAFGSTRASLPAGGAVIGRG